MCSLVRACTNIQDIIHFICEGRNVTEILFDGSPFDESNCVTK